MNPILELQHQRMLLQMEYEEEKQAFQQAADAIGIDRRVARGDAWFPIRIGRSYYNSLNQLCIEVYRNATTADEEPADHNFEFGRPVQFFGSEKLEVRSEKSQHSLGGPSASKGNNTSHLSPLTSHFADFRYSIHPKHPQPDADFKPRPYYQVFAQNHGFIPNLSILDLLFNMGPESIFYL